MKNKGWTITLTGGPADGQTYILDCAVLHIALPTMEGLAYYEVDYDPTLSVPIGAHYVERSQVIPSGIIESSSNT